jgi:hypothetical protein
MREAREDDERLRRVLLRVAPRAPELARPGDAARALPDGRGEVRIKLRTGGEREPEMILGRNFQLDGDLAERLASLDGLANVQLGTQRAPNLRLVA